MDESRTGSVKVPRKGGRRARRRQRAAAEQAADKLTVRQHGAIARRQALDLKVTRARIDARLQTGVWQRTEARGVYVSAGSVPTPEQALMVACLAGGKEAVASHLSAAALLGFARHPKLPQVTVPASHSGRFGGATVYRAAVPGQDRTMVGRIPCTQPARTLVDCAAVVRADALEELVDSAFCRYKTLTVSSVLRSLGRVRPDGWRKGSVALRRALEAWSRGLRAHSPMEMRLFRRLEEWGFPLPERQLVIRDDQGRFIAKADVGWSRIRFVLEYESDEYHPPRKWPSDDARAKRVRDVGYRIEQVYNEDLWPWSTRLRSILEERFAEFEEAA
ncbi:MAG TPA: hypothetical protein VG034_01800 [Acidimicrobiia bacterium]|nr:hypothetical protein [Acidimicrobiia bacterium]